MGILMAPHCVYAVYNTGNTLLKWEYKTEVRLNAFLQHYLLRASLPWPAYPFYAIMTGSDMDMAFRLLTSTGGIQKKHCSCWILRMNTSISCPITATENTCSVYWYNPSV